MAVKIRLARTGRKKMAFYRVVVADSKMPRDGRCIAYVGTYAPRENPAKIVIDGAVSGALVDVWPSAVGPLHDWVMERILDRLEALAK